MFHQTFGYYAHGVADNTAILPYDWQDRLITVQNQNTGGGIGLCLDPHDLAVSKLAAGREKDIEFVQIMLKEQMVDCSVMEYRLGMLPIPPDRLSIALSRLKKIEAKG